jgi:hypothetical protein
MIKQSLDSLNPVLVKKLPGLQPSSVTTGDLPEVLQPIQMDVDSVEQCD